MGRDNLGNPGSRKENCVKTDRREIKYGVCVCVDWIHLDQDGFECILGGGHGNASGGSLEAKCFFTSVHMILVPNCYKHKRTEF